MDDLAPRVEKAVQHFWKTRKRQAEKQGGKTGKKDAGTRADVTGGAQMDGFVELVRDLLREAGAPEASILCKRRTELPGYFRAEKQWDLLVILDRRLIATIEMKSQVGSFGNNCNNRSEEAIGTAVDLRTAYRDGALKPSGDPWVGYLMLLEDAEKSRSPIKPKEPHFKVFPEFRGASYAKRYEILLTRVLRERLYDGACLLLSDKKAGLRGTYSEPCEELAFKSFAASLLAHVSAHVRLR